ncbi:MAG: PASTA domain-containing protein [Bacteroidales bacterium]|jgi:cell division protein FtsI (penicillin-binding protein 3)|nr:PASTA domain-containing protein [Bacteroidales bacterium]
MKKKGRIYGWTLFFYCGFVFFAIYCYGFAVSVLSDTELKDREKKARIQNESKEKFRRGDILSFDGQALAAYFPKYNLFADFNVGRSKKLTIDRRKVSTNKKNPVTLDTFRINVYKDLSGSLSKVLGGTAATYYKYLYDNRIKAENREGSTKNILGDKIDLVQRNEIFSSPYLAKRSRNITGIYTKEAADRTYPFGKDFAHSAIGTVSGDNTVSGIENIYNEDLKNGDNIITTIDPRMQDICEVILRNKISEDKRLIGGTIIVMDVSTGDIKAIANAGKYNEENFSSIRDIYNNAAKASIEPGSTFKTVSLMLALETGKISLYEKFSTKIWRIFSEENKFDSLLTVSRIIELSSNTGTGNMVDKAFDRNVNKFIEAIKSLKITDQLSNMDDPPPYVNTKLDNKSMLRISHGYQIQLSPIHILSFYNAIANNGVMVNPRLARGLIRRNTEKIEIFEPEIISRSVCSKTTLDTVRMVLSRVVGQGSAQQIAGRPYGISGKTGTAMINLQGGKYSKNELSREMSSFCGYFPEKKPKYSCIVVLYSRFLNTTERVSFSASSTSVPVFGKVADKIYALYLEKNFMPSGNTVNIPVVKNARGENLSTVSRKLGLDIPVDSDGWLKVEEVNRKLQTSEISVKNGIVPDVTGMGLRDAVFLLENKGLKVYYSGIGTIVKQSPEKGTPYNPNQKIYLVLGS